MDVIDNLSHHNHGAITCVETHTVGMPCRIVIKGYPRMVGSLLSQKEEAARKHDNIRKRIILEPRGHSDMFGAVLRPNTEMTESGEAHMGLLYLHSGGYSNMCGHATIAVSRFLVDTQDVEVFPQRKLVKFDQVTQTACLVLHTPGGLVGVTVPTAADGHRSDPTRPITIIALPAYAMATDLTIAIQQEHRWPELGTRTSVNVSIAYCSAFSCQIQLHELGFPEDTLQSSVPFDNLKYAVAQLKKAINSPPYEKFLRNPSRNAIDSLFGVMVAAKGFGDRPEGTKGVETGLYLFADGVIDRSPTGSLAAARNAVAFAKGDIEQGETWTYHCLVSNTIGQGQGFTARTIEGAGRRKIEEGGYAAGPVKVEIQGYAYYTGYHTFLVEERDPLGDNGFEVEKLV